MRMQKKAQGDSFNWVGGAVIAVLLIVIISVIIKDKTDTTNSGLNTQAMASRMKLCLSQAQDMYGNRKPDYDGDGMPDCCDPCPETPNNNPTEYPDNDNDMFPTVKAGPGSRTFGCLGNDGKLPYTKEGKLNVEAYHNQIIAAKGSVEDESLDKNPKKHPTYNPTC
jgi:hypothetical protein